jgi:hypothetical protein
MLPFGSLGCVEGHMTKRKERHVVSHREPVIINGVVIGESFSSSFEDGPPRFGLCVVVDCPKRATKETLIGLHFCDEHLEQFYFAEECPPLDPSREFPEPTTTDTH